MKKLYLVFVIFTLLGCRKIELIPENTSFVYPSFKQFWGVAHLQQWHLKLLAGIKTRFDEPQGVTFSFKNGTTEIEKIYIVNTGDNSIIQIKPPISFSVYGNNPEHIHFDNPWGITSNNYGDLYVVDRGNARIVHLKDEKCNLNYVKDIGIPGDKFGEFTDPRGIALLTDGSLLITDAALGRITLFDPQSKPVAMWESFLTPDAIVAVGKYDSLTDNDNEEFIVFIDSLYQRVNKMDFKGNILRQSSISDWGFKSGYLSGIVIDLNNQVIITDKHNHCLHKLDSQLNYITTFNKPTNEPILNEPRGITINRQTGEIIITERDAIRFLQIAVDVSNFKATVKKESVWQDLEISFLLTEPALCRLDLQDYSGRFLARLIENRFYPAGKNTLMWGLKLPAQLPNGKPLPPLPPEYTPGQPLTKGKYILKGMFQTIYKTNYIYERQATTSFEVN